MRVHHHQGVNYLCGLLQIKYYNMSRVKKKHLSWIEERMQYKGINQEQLAKFLKVHRSTVSRLFAAGVPKLDPARMDRLCVALGVASCNELTRLCQPEEAKTMYELQEEWTSLTSE